MKNSCGPGWLAAAALAMGFAVLAGCDQPTIAQAEKVMAGEPGAAAVGGRTALGWRTYERYCVGCHGTAGDGEGAAAPFLHPRPRDFTRGIFKFTSTPANSLPTDADLLRVIDRGLRGTSMPSYALLSTAEKEALVAVIKSFSPDWQELPPERPVSVPPNPFGSPERDSADQRAAIELGEAIYHGKAQCWTCHPVYASPRRLEVISEQFDSVVIQRDRPREPVLKEDEWGQLLKPPDFTRDRPKSVDTLDDLYRVIAAGVGGTAMASWEGSLSAEELWAVTLYVDSLMGEDSEPVPAVLAPEEGW